MDTAFLADPDYSLLDPKFLRDGSGRFFFTRLDTRTGESAVWLRDGNDETVLIDVNDDNARTSIRSFGPGVSHFYRTRFLTQDGDGDVLVVSPIANYAATAQCNGDTNLPCKDFPAPDWCAFVGDYVELPQSNEIFRMNRYGTIKQRLTNNAFFEGELAVSPDFQRVVFASNRDGDYDLYLANLDDMDNPKRITNTLGYEGAVQFASDGRTIAFLGWRPQSTESRELYNRLLSYNTTDLGRMDVFLLDLESGQETKITDFAALSGLPEANNTWDQPYFSFAPSGELYIRQGIQFYCVQLPASPTVLNTVIQK
ncbi:hypothetical protein M3Y99_01222800 [Aphelenchoides fujianensis]|nr:hypothetical protein M3Y99_01222800 [Aphelenchoides fujianensis]